MIVAHSAFYDASVSILLQTPKVLVTLLLNEKPSDGAPLAITPRGSKFLCTYKGIKTVPSKFFELVNGNVPTFVNNGDIHAPFVPDDEKKQYGRMAVAKLSSARSHNAKRIGKTIMEELEKTDVIRDDHIFVVHENDFHKYHTL